jgi:hypothetical protein
MGNMCTNPTLGDNELLTTIINIKEYTAKTDEFYNKFENFYNLLEKANLNDFTDYINNECDDNIKAELTEESLEHFLDKYVIRNDGRTQKIFKMFVINIYKLVQKANQIYNKLKSHTPDKNLKYMILFIMGLLYCQSDLQSKIDIIFTTLSINGKFSKSDDIHSFFFNLFIIPTLISLESIKEVLNKYKEIDIFISEKYFNDLTLKFSIRNVFNLVEIFHKNFFDETEKYNMNKFTSKIIQDDFSWIFSRSGIRYYLEKYNFS